jgi:hypothetical protein
MAKRKGTKRQTIIYKSLHRNLRIEGPYKTEVEKNLSSLQNGI